MKLNSLFKISENYRDKDKIKTENIGNVSTIKWYDSIDISTDLKFNISLIENIFNKCDDLIIRLFKNKNDSNITGAIIYIDGITSNEILEISIVEKVTLAKFNLETFSRTEVYIKEILCIKEESVHTTFKKTINEILNGNIAILFDGIQCSFNINLYNPPQRSIEESNVEKSLRGPRESFTESILQNTAMVRKLLKNNDLKIENMTLGTVSNTMINILYIEGISSDTVLNEVKNRLNKITSDFVLGSNYIRERIEDEPLSSLPTIFSTEKPDVLVGKLLQGRVCILIDGTPDGLSMPAFLFEFLVNVEDHYLRIIPATINRFLRYTGFLISIFLAGTYVAITTFHQELVPTDLLITFITEKTGVPFSSFIEALILMFSFELLREASSRMPTTLASSLSVVGALILGEAAVSAGLVSTPMVIITAIGSIATFTVPSADISLSFIYFRLIFLILGTSMGLIGLTFGFIIFTVHLISLRSFGEPYLSPLAPYDSSRISGIFVRPIKFKKQIKQ